MAFETDPRTEEYLRKILEAKDEKSSIRSQSTTLKNEHDKYARGLMHVFKEEGLECVEVPPGPVFVRVSERNPRKIKVNAKQVNDFSKQMIESKELCLLELGKTLDLYLSNPSQAMEELEKTLNAARPKKGKSEED